MVKPGDVYEAALWYNSEKPTERLEAEHGVRVAMSRESVALSPITFKDMTPGEDRVPEVPPHFTGQPRLLVGSATVARIYQKAMDSAPGFIHDLDVKELLSLRKITRRVHSKRWPRASTLTDPQCDAIINELGPQAALKTLRDH